jgi:hypothetical protein
MAEELLRGPERDADAIERADQPAPQGRLGLPSAVDVEHLNQHFRGALGRRPVRRRQANTPPVAARYRPHFVFARLGAGVCDGMVCSGAFFATLPDACGLGFVPSTTRFVRLVSQGVCPSGLGVAV